MPTLRSRPSKGSDILSPTESIQHSPPAKTPTRRGRTSVMATDATEVRESIEAKRDIDGDIEMQDENSKPETADAPEKTEQKVAETEQDAADDVDADGEVDEEADGEGEEEDEDSRASQPVSNSIKDLLNLINECQAYLSNYEEDGIEIAAGFQRLPSKRHLPDYFDVIKTPVAFSSVRARLLKKDYTHFGEFVQQVAQICHNAQVYNRPSAPIFEAAIRLREIFKAKLEEYVKKGLIKPEEAVLPDLGELPPVEDSPPPGSDEEAEEEEEEEDEDEEDDEDTDGEGPRRRGGRRKRGGRQARGGRKDADDDEDAHAKTRGRPPKVLTPLEGRINAILKGLRRFKNDDGDLRVLPFEKMPDKATVKDYYTVIKNPIALDLIKRKYKRKKYHSVDEVLADLELMFENAKQYNEEGSQVYNDAVELQQQARLLVEQEKAKPDDSFRDEDGKLPLPYIEYKGETWRVGDWVHINNPNDPRKPIVAQIYRTWQDSAGHKWVNACWYYRPEQTVHHYEKHFYENEVVKTGQYRDHRIEEIDDRCFVMFITRYPKGRPRGFPASKSVYVCDSRYNEERFKFNHIKTWASCLPDEVRDKDYEMDLFGAPMKMKKLPSPIKHLLQVDAKETDDLPKPTWANPNAPPMIGAVHRRPRDPNESPPPEPTPPPMATPLMPQMQPMDSTRRPSFNQGNANMGGMSGGPGLNYRPAHVPSPAPALHFQHQFVPSARPVPTPTPPLPMHQNQHGLPPMMPSPHVPPQQPMPQQTQFHAHVFPQQPPPPQHYTPQPVQAAPVHHPLPSPVPTYDTLQPPPPRPVHHQQPMMPTPVRTPMAPTPSVSSISHANVQPHPNQYTNQYQMPRPYEVYRFMDPAMEASIPPDVRSQFKRDDQGRLLWFTAAGRDRSAANGLAPEYANLGHSVSHLANIGDIREERRRKRKERDEELAREAQASKRASTEREITDAEEAEKARLAVLGQVLTNFAEGMAKGTQLIEEDVAGFREEKAAWNEERRAGRV